MSPDIKQNFSRRHIGPNSTDQNQMLSDLGFNSIDALMEQTLPESIRTNSGLNIGDGLNEFNLLKTIKEVASKNKVARSYIGMGYYGTITPPVIQRNILENPGWYTAYTPYQAEISQGRLEALLNSNPIGIELVIQSTDDFEFNENVFGALLQYPATDGKVTDFTNLCEQAHDNGVRVAVATDLLSLAILPSPGEIGADVAIGSSQRFGVPMGFGGPHAAFIAAKEEFKRKMPGRIIGVSQDSHGNRALRMALQTREQHIRRDKATSNICTAQVLLAVMAGMYAVYHGAEGIRAIAKTVHQKTKNLASAILHGGHTIIHDQFFDTIRVKLYGISPGELKQNAEKHNLNFRYFDNGEVGISLDETVSPGDLVDILLVFNVKNDDRNNGFDLRINRSTEYLTHEVFSAYHTETEMMRYLHRLEAKDLTLNTSMISLGSCTMKLNAAVEMMPITWPEFAFLHPFAPSHQTEGYKQLCDSLASWLMDITGLQGCSLQPNSGAQGEFAGLLVIRAYHLDRGDSQRNICLIPASAHGTHVWYGCGCGQMR